MFKNTFHSSHKPPFISTTNADWFIFREIIDLSCASHVKRSSTWCVVWAKGRVFLMSNSMVYIVTILRLTVNYALHHEDVEEGRFSITFF